MLADYVGEEKFLKGVSIYLKNHLYGNTVTNDLWEGIGEATGKDIPSIMDNWINKIGFPLLTVTESKEGVTVRQDRFLESGPAPDKENETIWTIPLSLLSVGPDGKAVVDKSAVLDVREKVLAIDPSKPFKLNAGTTGVYRVLYTPERLAKIAAEAATGDAIFTLRDRIGLVHDTFDLAKAGFADVSSALTLVDILKEEREFLVWESMSDNVATLVSTWWEDSEVVDSLNKLRRVLYNPIIQRLGYEYSSSDSPDVTELRTRAISQAAQAQDAEVLKELKGRFDHYLKTGDDSKIPADLIRIAFSTATKHGGREEWEFAKKIVDNPPTPSAKSAAITAMASTQDLDLINETLDYMTNKARDQDVVYFISGIASNFKTRRLMFEFFTKNYDAIYTRFAGNTMLKYIVSSAISSLSTEADYQAVEKFFSDKDISKYNLALAQSQEGIRAKITWLERSTGNIRTWLQKWEKENSSKL